MTTVHKSDVQRADEISESPNVIFGVSSISKL